MELRDKFALQAMSFFGFEREEMNKIEKGIRPSHEAMAKICYETADAMLKERAKEQPNA